MISHPATSTSTFVAFLSSTQSVPFVGAAMNSLTVIAAGSIRMGRPASGSDIDCVISKRIVGDERT